MPNYSNLVKDQKFFGNIKEKDEVYCSTSDNFEKQKSSKSNLEDSIAVTGIAGKYPDSENIEVFAANLYNKRDMVTVDKERWPKELFGAPEEVGRLPELKKFDRTFFNVNEKEANFMDQQLRILLEITYEAIWDSGNDPKNFAGERTGVFLGCIWLDHMTAHCRQGNPPEYAQYYSQMISHKFNFTGPSFTADSACAASFSALNEAVIALNNNICDTAIVAGLNLGINPFTQSGFFKIQMLSPDGKCKCLDESANGYAKGEACVAIVLQKESIAKRNYMTIIHIKSNNDGYEELGITYPTWKTQSDLMKATYAEACIDPNVIDYIEAHCTGTQAGDNAEMKAITDSMCSGDRKTPLLIGALKSSVGHSEGSSGISALSKVIILFENQCIPANIHYNNPNPKIDGINSGILKPITENTPFNGDLVGINNFGFGGSNVHLIVKSPKLKPSIDNNRIVDKIPRLIQMCARDKSSVTHFFESLLEYPHKITRDLLSLINNISKTSAFPSNIGYNPMNARGFLLVENIEETVNAPGNFNIQEISEQEREVWFIFSGMGTQYSAMAKDLIKIEIFEKSIRNLCEKMNKYSIDLWDLLMNESIDISDSTMDSCLAISAVQIALYDLLQELNIKPKGFVGHSNGELLCAYADGCISAEETMDLVYWRSKCVIEDESTRGSMAAIGLGAQEVKRLSSSNIYIACDNSEDSVTIAGKSKEIMDFVESLKSKKILATIVQSSGIAYHCPILNSAEEQLTAKLNTVFADSRRKTTRWRSTQLAYIKSEYITSYYFVDNLLQTNYFNQAIKHIPSNAVIVEVSPNCLFKSIIKRSLGPNISYVPLMVRNKDNLNLFLSGVGTLYTLGLNPNIEILYPKVDYPVSNGTRNLSPLISWNHSEDYVVTKYPEFFNVVKQDTLKHRVILMDKKEAYIGDHRIDGTCIFPPSGYLILIWKHLADYLNIKKTDLAIEYRDVTFSKVTLIETNKETILQTKWNQLNGLFEVSESGSVVCTGRIIPFEERNDLKFINILRESSCDDIRAVLDTLVLTSNDIYKDLRLRGYDYGPNFQCIDECYCDSKVVKAKIDWRDNWITFTDAMFQMAVLGIKSKGLYILEGIETLRINPQVLLNEVRLRGEDAFLESIFDSNSSIGCTKGLEYMGLKLRSINRNQNSVKPFLGYYGFEPYINNEFVYSNQNDLLDYSIGCDRMALEISTSISISSNGMITKNKPIAKYAENSVKTIESKENKILFELLNKFSEIPEQISVDSLIDSETKSLLANDMICKEFNCQPFLEPLLVTVFENRLSSEMKIAEFNATNDLLYPEIRNAFDLYDYDCRIDYTLIHPSPNQLPDSVLNTTEVKQWDTSGHSVPTNMSDIELIVYKDISVQSIDKERVDLKQLFESFYNKLKANGFLLIVFREELTIAEQIVSKLLGLKQTTIKRDKVLAEGEELKFTFIGNYSDVFSVNALLFRKITTVVEITKQIFIEITHNFEDWMERLQNELKSINSRPEGQNIWLVSKSDPINGILGFYNCIRKELNGNRIRVIFNTNKKQMDCLLDRNNSELKSIVRKDLKTNIIRGKQLGYFKMNAIKATAEPVLSEHCFLKNTIKGDLTSLQWFECQHKLWPIDKRDNQMLCHVYYYGLNFSDTMLERDGLSMDSILGYEFSGRDEKGNRVMGMSPSKSLATTCIIEDKDFLWSIPEHWSMEEAATVPYVYATAYYALIIRGKLLNNEKVLIHSGSGGIGQACIRICLSLDCLVFITVGSETEKDFLKHLFPTLTNRNFSSSRDMNFKTHIMHETNGLGVDVVINSLTKEKLKESIKCMEKNGRFLEIGKHNMSVDSGLDISEILPYKTFNGILLDSLLTTDINVSKFRINERIKIWHLMNKGINAGVVKPLNRTIFSTDKCEEAFNFMISDGQTGKVVIKFRDEEKQQNSLSMNSTKLLAIPRTVFYSNKTYVITGVLGGMGLELIDWMIERGAKIFVLTSRFGPKDGYQYKKLKSFAESSTTVNISNEDLSTITGAKSLLRTAQTLGPIGGIFHIQGVSSDGLFDNQTIDSFNKVCAQKSIALEHLDSVSRILCPNIDYFVAYSSVVSSRGNAGQSNYGFSNSVIDRICDLRRADGLHALAIQWGLIGDVGIVADSNGDKELQQFGTKPQRMHSCLTSLDRILQSKHSICISFVRSETNLVPKEELRIDLLKTVANILGLADLTQLDSNTKLVKLGLDSLMSVEVQQIIERDFALNLSTDEVRELTLAMVHKINSGIKLTDN